MLTELIELRKELADIQSSLQQKDTRIESLEIENRLLRQKLYGQTSERISLVDPTVQPNLFNEAEAERLEGEKPEEEIEVPAHRRAKGGRRPLPVDLPREDVIHDIPDVEKVCGCGYALSRIGEEVTEELDVVPAQYRVIRHVRYKYACRSCEGVESEKAVQIAPAPVQLLPKTIATAGLIASVVVEKFGDGLPLYRQATRFERHGIEISRGTLSNWVVRVGELCHPIRAWFREYLRAGPMMNVDETTLQVLNEHGRSNTTKSYMWVFRRGPVVIFDYRPTRSGDEILREYLTGYTGCVQTDGYVGYEVLSSFPGIVHAGCWAHARRKFVEVVKAMEKAKAGARRSGSADIALGYIRRLYDIERGASIKEIRGDELIALRHKQSQPILDEFRQWLGARVGSTPPQGILGKAMGYTLNQWDRLIVFATHPEVGLDNNAVENAIRPFAIGRKNWLFAGSPAGAEASATLYSLVETAKASGLEPYRYLRYVFERLPYASTPDDYRVLTPIHLDRALFAGAAPIRG